MKTIKQSFLSNLIGRENYEEFQYYAKFIVVIGFCILSVLFLLASLVHWTFISNLLNLFTGTSLLFLAFIASLILVLDFQVDVDEAEKIYFNNEAYVPKPFKYKITVVWGILLLLLGLAATYYSNKYRKYYEFECSTFLVDIRNGIYHIDWDNDCEVAAQSDDLIKMRGYEMNKTYTLCTWCEEWVEDAEFEYRSNRYYRK